MFTSDIYVVKRQSHATWFIFMYYISRPLSILLKWSVSTLALQKNIHLPSWSSRQRNNNRTADYDYFSVWLFVTVFILCLCLHYKKFKLIFCIKITSCLKLIKTKKKKMIKAKQRCKNMDKQHENSINVDQILKHYNLKASNKLKHKYIALWN